MTRVTPNYSAPTGLERAVPLAGAMVIHLGLLALFLSLSSGSVIPDGRPVVTSLIPIAPAHGTKSPPPAMSSDVSGAKQVAANLAISADIESGQIGATVGCATTDHVGKAIVADPAAVAAVIAAPSDSRSIAEAVVLWNHGWMSNANAVDAPLGQARRAVEQTLSSLAPECLNEPIAGPRLIPIPAGNGTMFLVIGSGTWSWRQLLDQPDAIVVSEETGLKYVLSDRGEWF